MSRRLERRWSLAILAALTAFAQFVMAAEPCMLAHDASIPVEHQAMGAERCDAMPMDAASCLARCLGGDESVSTFFPLPVAIACAPAPLDFTAAGTYVAAVVERDAPPCGPPLQILYCSFQS